MKKSIFYLVAIVIVVAGCGNSDNNSQSETDSTEIVESNQPDNQEVADENVAEDEPEEENKLAEYLKPKKLAFEQFTKLQAAIASQDEIKSLSEVEKVLKMRDSLITLLNNDDTFYNYMEEGDRFYEDFEAIGIQLIEAEGMFGGLDQAPLLEKVIERVADEPYILNNKIQNLNGGTHGSEYPYLDISEEVEIVPLAEKMLTKYPGNKYNEEIVKILEYSLFPLTDFHKTPDGFSNYISGGYDVSAYPGATDISYHKTFVEKYGSSRFAKIVSRILKNTSTLETREFNKLYLIQVPDLGNNGVFADEHLNDQLQNLPKDLKSASSCLKYMWLGVDIPHQITLREGDENKQICVYRFFDTKEPAVKSLAVIQKTIPSAKLVEYELTEADKKYRN